MSVFSVYLPVKRENYNITPFKVHKEYTIDSSSISDEYYVFYEGRYKKTPSHISSSRGANDPKNSDGVYMSVAYSSLNNMFYKHDSYYLENPDVDNTDKYIFLTSSTLYCPYYDIGEGIKPGSVVLTDKDSSIIYNDDSQGNLYDSSVSTGSFYISEDLIIDIVFDELYKNTKSGYGKILSASLPYNSTNHSPDYNLDVRNVMLEEGLPYSSSFIGSSIYLSSSFVYLKNNEYISLDTEDDFTVSFWINTTASNDNEYQYIFSKRGTLEYLKYGDYTDYNEAGDPVSRRGLYPVTQNVTTTVYPISFKYISSGSDLGKVLFERSDGSTKIEMLTSSSINDGNYHNICLSKTGSLVNMYVDGVLESSGSDVSGEVFNYHDYIIGSLNLERQHSFVGNLFDIRVFNIGSSQDVVYSLIDTSSMSFRSTNNVGNTFYKSGVLTLTSPHPKYYNTFSNDFELYFKNTVTHYEFETVCSIKKGSFNFTLNPSSLETFKSKKYKPEMISGSLKPYATTVGLYNVNNELVAVGKLASPIKIRDDIDMNIIVKFDY